MKGNFLVGPHAVLEALRAGRRNIERIFLARVENDGRIAGIIRLGKLQGGSVKGGGGGRAGRPLHLETSGCWDNAGGGEGLGRGRGTPAGCSGPRPGGIPHVAEAKGNMDLGGRSHSLAVTLRCRFPCFASPGYWWRASGAEA